MQNETSAKGRSIVDKLKIDDVIYTVPQIELSGDRMASIHGCSGVSDYEDARISLVTGGLLTVINGEGLELVSLSEGEAVIRGRLTSIEYL